MRKRILVLLGIVTLGFCVGLPPSSNRSGAGPGARDEAWIFADEIIVE